MAIIKRQNLCDALPKHYGIVKTKHGSHPRNYKREIAGGMNSVEATWKAACDSATFTMTNLFDNLEGFKA